MLLDVSRLVLLYTVEQFYWFPRWIEKLKPPNKIPDREKQRKIIHKYNWDNKEFYIHLIKLMKRNPRASRYLLDLIDKNNYNFDYSGGKIIIFENPSPRIHKFISQCKNITDEDYIFHMINRTDDPEYKQYAITRAANGLNKLIKIYGNNGLGSDIISSISERGDTLIKLFEEPIKQSIQHFYGDLIYKSRQIPILSRNPSDVALDILKTFPNLINYYFLCKNPNPGAIKLLNSNPDKITSNIFMNPNQSIVSMSEHVLNNTQFIPDETNINIYREILTNMKLDINAIIFNPGAIGLIENNLDLLALIFNKDIEEKYKFETLPSNITSIIVDELIRLVVLYGYIPEQILKCNSRELIRLYETNSSVLTLHNLENIAWANEYILSENKYGMRLIDFITRKLDF